MLHALMLSLRGIPVFYSGDEIGMLNDYSYHEDPKKAADSRYIHRGVFDWDLAEKRHTKGETAAALFEGLAHLIRMRKKHEVFRSDAVMRAVDTGDDRILGIIREYGGRTLLALYNFAPEHCRAWIDTAEWTDLTDPARDFVPGTDERMEYWLEPYGFRWLIKEN